MMFHPLIFQVMFEDFKNLVELIKAFNVLYGSISDTTRFEYKFIKDRMHIFGRSVDLALIYSLLWASTEKYAFTLAHNGDCTFIEVIALF